MGNTIGKLESLQSKQDELRNVECGVVKYNDEKCSVSEQINGHELFADSVKETGKVQKRIRTTTGEVHQVKTGKINNRMNIANIEICSPVISDTTVKMNCKRLNYVNKITGSRKCNLREDETTEECGTPASLNIQDPIATLKENCFEITKNNERRSPLTNDKNEKVTKMDEFSLITVYSDTPISQTSLCNIPQSTNPKMEKEKEKEKEKEDDIVQEISVIGKIPLLVEGTDENIILKKIFTVSTVATDYLEECGVNNNVDNPGLIIKSENPTVSHIEKESHKVEGGTETLNNKSEVNTTNQEFKVMTTVNDDTVELKHAGDVGDLNSIGNKHTTDFSTNILKPIEKYTIVQTEVTSKNENNGEVECVKEQEGENGKGVIIDNNIPDVNHPTDPMTYMDVTDAVGVTTSMQDDNSRMVRSRTENKDVMNSGIRGIGKEIALSFPSNGCREIALMNISEDDGEFETDKNAATGVEIDEREVETSEVTKDLVNDNKCTVTVDIHQDSDFNETCNSSITMAQIHGEPSTITPNNQVNTRNAYSARRQMLIDMDGIEVYNPESSPESLPINTKKNKREEKSFDEFVEIPLRGTKSEDADVPLCRICCEGEVCSKTIMNDICKCTGTADYIHKECLDTWMENSISNKGVCEICKTSYVRYHRPFSFDYMVVQHPEEIFGMLMIIFCAALILVAGTLYVFTGSYIPWKLDEQILYFTMSRRPTRRR